MGRVIYEGGGLQVISYNYAWPGETDRRRWDFITTNNLLATLDAASLDALTEALLRDASTAAYSLTNLPSAAAIAAAVACAWCGSLAGQPCSPMVSDEPWVIGTNHNLRIRAGLLRLGLLSSKERPGAVSGRQEEPSSDG